MKEKCKNRMMECGEPPPKTMGKMDKYMKCCSDNEVQCSQEDEMEENEVNTVTFPVYCLEGFRVQEQKSN